MAQWTVIWTVRLRNVPPEASGGVHASRTVPLESNATWVSMQQLELVSGTLRSVANAPPERGRN
jgi:hypothetical protein